MENQNGNGQDLSQLKNMFANYQQKQQNTGGGGTVRKSREDFLAKYFNPRATREIFRILPPKNGRGHIEEAFFHTVPLNFSGGKIRKGQKVYCPAHNDPKVPKLDLEGNPILTEGKPILVPAPCALCAKNKAMLATQDQSIRRIKKEDLTEAQKPIFAKNSAIYKEANVWEAKKFYIIRGVDKGKEKDGVKFWRFKHNYKNQGTLDKILPILKMYMEDNQVDFADPELGTDLNIVTADSEFNGIQYKSISAITAKGKSPLHGDPIVAKSWLDDDTTWRDVYKAKQAPNMNQTEYLEAIATGTNPYWDDTDSNNKHWVFPGRPDLQEKANTRNQNLDAEEDTNFEQASDLSGVNIGNVTTSDVGTYNDDASNLGQEAAQTANPVIQEGVQTPTPVQPATPVAPVQPAAPVEQPAAQEAPAPVEEADDYPDLPF